MTTGLDSIAIAGARVPIAQSSRSLTRRDASRSFGHLDAVFLGPPVRGARSLSIVEEVGTHTTHHSPRHQSTSYRGAGRLAPSESLLVRLPR